MEWIDSVFFDHGALQALVVISIISALGLALGKLKIAGVSLGVTFVFFVGILAGHFGLSIDHTMLVYAEDFGLVLFVYALGLQVGPGFFSSLARGGVRLNMLGLGVALLGLAMAVAVPLVSSVSLADVMGVFCGATTNTPALGAVQQTLSQLGLPADTAALGCAVTYPLGVVGVILAIILMRKVFASVAAGGSEVPDEPNRPAITEFQITNPAIVGKSVAEVSKMSGLHFVVSRRWRSGTVCIPTGDTVLEAGDHILVVSTHKDLSALQIVFGEQEQKNWNAKNIDWNAVDRQLVSQRILVTRPELNGRRLGSLRLRNLYGINISRVYRSGVQLLATPDLRLQMGDRLTVVGEQQAVNNVSAVLGNAVLSLREPNLVAVFVGIVLGLIVGSIPFSFPGVSMPVRLGLAGGPIIMGILVGTFGPRLHMITYTTLSANKMLRALGLTMYLACLGLDAGAHFFETVFRAEGLLWIGTGFLLTVLPVLIGGFVAIKLMRLDFGTAVGTLCGTMANPMALDYANSIINGDKPSVAYATVYPLCMFARVIMVQIAVLLFC